AFAETKRSAAETQLGDSLKAVRNPGQEAEIRPAGRFARIEKLVRRPVEYSPLPHQNCKRLVIAGRTEFQPARGDLSVLTITPDIEPGIIGRLPYVAQKQFVRRAACRDPAILLAVGEYERSHVMLHSGPGPTAKSPQIDVFSPEPHVRPGAGRVT